MFCGLLLFISYSKVTTKQSKPKNRYVLEKKPQVDEYPFLLYDPNSYAHK